MFLFYYAISLSETWCLSTPLSLDLSKYAMFYYVPRLYRLTYYLPMHMDNNKTLKNYDTSKPLPIVDPRATSESTWVNPRVQHDTSMTQGRKASWNFASSKHIPSYALFFRRPHIPSCSHRLSDPSVFR